MRLAIFSDIHGNWDALKTVLADMDRNRIDSRFCLGDCVGYGPEPKEVIREIRALKIPWVRASPTFLSNAGSFPSARGSNTWSTWGVWASPGMATTRPSR